MFSPLRPPNEENTKRDSSVSITCVYVCVTSCHMGALGTHMVIVAVIILTYPKGSIARCSWLASYVESVALRMYVWSCWGLGWTKAGWLAGKVAGYLVTMRSEFDDPSFRWKEKGSRLQPLGHLEPIGQVHKVSRWAGGLARAFSSLLDLICYIGSGPKHRNRVYVCVSLSLSFCLFVCPSVLSYQMMMHMALMGNLCMKRLSIIPSHVYMYVCVCVCAPLL